MSETQDRVQAVPAITGETIYDSAPARQDDDLWLEIGKLMLTESLTTIRNASNALMSALGVVQGIYLGILGFAKFIPEEWPILLKALFAVPFLAWLLALYCCIEVAMTKKLNVLLHSPDDIREQATTLIADKHRYLQAAFWLFVVGMAVAIGLLLTRLDIR